jgi:hypothetical protein
MLCQQTQEKKTEIRDENREKQQRMLCENDVRYRANARQERRENERKRGEKGEGDKARRRERGRGMRRQTDGHRFFLYRRSRG